MALLLSVMEAALRQVLLCKESARINFRDVQKVWYVDQVTRMIVLYTTNECYSSIPAISWIKPPCIF